jgi:hypothetical protein
MNPDSIADGPHRPAHEPLASSLRNVFIIAGSVAVMLGLCLATAGILLRAYSEKRPMQPMQPLGILVAPNSQPLTRLPAPNLELDDGHADSAAFNDRETEQLNSYGWVDRSRGIARIPIERAMDLIAARHLPVATNSSASRSASNLIQSGGIP